MDGWDGLVRTSFFSAYSSETTWYITLIVSMPPRRRFMTSFVKKSKFFKNLFFVEKFRTKRGYFEKTVSFSEVCSSGVLEEISLNFFFSNFSFFRILRGNLTKKYHQYRKKWTSKTGVKSTFYLIERELWPNFVFYDFDC